VARGLELRENMPEAGLGAFYKSKAKIYKDGKVVLAGLEPRQLLTRSLGDKGMRPWNPATFPVGRYLFIVSFFCVPGFGISMGLIPTIPSVFVASHFAPLFYILPVVSIISALHTAVGFGLVKLYYLLPREAIRGRGWNLETRAIKWATTLLGALLFLNASGYARPLFVKSPPNFVKAKEGFWAYEERATEDGSGYGHYSNPPHGSGWRWWGPEALVWDKTELENSKVDLNDEEQIEEEGGLEYNFPVTARHNLYGIWKNSSILWLEHSLTRARVHFLTANQYYRSGAAMTYNEYLGSNERARYEGMVMANTGQQNYNPYPTLGLIFERHWFNQLHYGQPSFEYALGFAKKQYRNSSRPFDLYSYRLTPDLIHKVLERHIDWTRRHPAMSELVVYEARRDLFNAAIVDAVIARLKTNSDKWAKPISDSDIRKLAQAYTDEVILMWMEDDTDSPDFDIVHQSRGGLRMRSISNALFEIQNPKLALNQALAFESGSRFPRTGKAQQSIEDQLTPIRWNYGPPPVITLSTLPDEAYVGKRTQTNAPWGVNPWEERIKTSTGKYSFPDTDVVDPSQPAPAAYGGWDASELLDSTDHLGFDREPWTVTLIRHILPNWRNISVPLPRDLTIHPDERHELFDFLTDEDVEDHLELIEEPEDGAEETLTEFTKLVEALDPRNPKQGNIGGTERTGFVAEDSNLERYVGEYEELNMPSLPTLYEPNWFYQLMTTWVTNRVVLPTSAISPTMELKQKYFKQIPYFVDELEEKKKITLGDDFENEDEDVTSDAVIKHLPGIFGTLDDNGLKKGVAPPTLFSNSYPMYKRGSEYEVEDLVREVLDYDDYLDWLENTSPTNSYYTEGR
jgi:hypothetical protein